MVLVWCEWDIGCNDGLVIFADIATAKRYLEEKEVLKNCGIEESLSDCIADGLLGFREIQYIEKE